MAVPKRKTSKSRRDKRRGSNWKLTEPNICKCKNCGEFKLAHSVCDVCGYYRGVQIVDKKQA